MRFATVTFTILSWLAAGCAQEQNPIPTESEGDCLSQVIQLTSGFERAGEAYFSHDMHWLIFQAMVSGESYYQMFLAQIKSDQNGITGIGTPIRISPAGTWNSCGYFSPDGNSLIFASTAGSPTPASQPSGYQRQGGSYRWLAPEGAEIFRADGWQGAVAVFEPGKIVDLAQHRLTSNSSYDAEGGYSPDGKWIVFTSNRTGDQELWAMRAGGETPVQLTNKKGYDGGPFVSPEGRRIVYRSDRKGDDLLQVFVADLSFDWKGNICGSENERQLTRDKCVNWGPFWHPDGKHIIYAASGQDHGNYDVWLMRSDGSRKTRVTFDPSPDVLPVFSPDGNYVVWASRRNGQSSQIYLARFKLPPGS